MTVEEALRQSGLSDEAIKALDPKAIMVFNNTLTAAERAQEAAELAQRSNVDWYENKIAPSLTAWDEERSRLESERAAALAEVAYHRTLTEQAKRGGFIPGDAPAYVPAAGGAQRGYVAGAGSTPG